MRKPIIAGNWKMNKTASEAKAFAEAVKNKIPSNEVVDSVIGSPSLFLQELMASAEGTELKISAQNCFWENSGAFTGETSPAALADLVFNMSSLVTQNVVNTSMKLMKISTKKQKQFLQTA